MDIITLPGFIAEKRFGGNIIRQLICKDITVQNIISETAEGINVIDDTGKRICIIKRDKESDNQYDYVIVSNKKPSIEKIKSNEIKLQWHKHPLWKNKFCPEKVLESWDGRFFFREEDVEKGKFGLRTPQVGAIHSVLSHWKVSDEIGTVVMPTGTGKTETMMSLLIANKCEKLLVTVPTDSLREQIADKFTDLGVLKKFGIVSDEAQFPIVGIIFERFDDIDELKEFMDCCNVIITTMSIVTGSDPEIQREISKVCTHYFIDEAHHIKAKSWHNFLQNFPPNKVIQFTATPFRNDGQRLDGKIIFNYPLRKAQKEGYFKRINFYPIWEYSPDVADERIAEEAVKILNRDIESGYNHILMARCKDKNRADEVYECYKKFDQYNPVKLYSGMPLTQKRIIKDSIRNKETRIIVCVDMLGEGFDLPELKIAAFHDIRKSLPITLQLAGRFTRTKHDEELGEATFITNLANVDTTEELEELYAQDADWNLLLPQISTSQINQEIDFEEFIKGFSNLENTKISLQNIKPAFSAVIYKSKIKKWNPNNFKKGITLSPGDYCSHNINYKENMLIIITGNKKEIDWGNIKEVQNLEWNLIVVFWDDKNGLLFIHGSDKETLYADLANALIGENAEIIEKLDVFKAFYNINRITLQNVGLKEFLCKNIRFRMSVGTDVEEALSLAEKQKAQKAFVFGVGYENGEKVSLGCSYKGRIWTKLIGDLKQFSYWCKKIGEKVINPNIDPNMLLKDTLIPKLVSTIPKRQPVWIDWNDYFYLNPQTKVRFILDEMEYDLSDCDLTIDYSAEIGTIKFYLVTQHSTKVKLEICLFENNSIPDYEIKILETDYKEMTVKIGTKIFKITEFFYKFEPMVWFADGSVLSGNEYVELKQQILLYRKELIQCWQWDGVDISKESQGVAPKVVDSIQYYLIKELLKKDYDIIYDDDYSGEIADVITIKQVEKRIKVELYHLKYAKGGNVSSRIDNLYEVCGQAQKSVHWKHKDGKEFFDHLLRRQTKFENGKTCSRIEKGDEKKLIYFSQIAKKKFPIEFEIYIVQPGLSPRIVSDEQLTLLGVTENFLKEIGSIGLKVIGNQ